MIDVTKKELKQKYGNTKVFVIKDSLLGSPKIFEKLYEHMVFGEELLCELGKFIFRYDAELDPTYRQIIPYCIVKFKDKYFITQRIQGDNRLVDKFSIGIGGHVEDINYTKNIIQETLIRELNEELDIRSNIKSIELEGSICSNDTEVDKVHLGLVYIIELDGINVEVKEKDILEGEWISKIDLINFNRELESWSKIVIDNLIKNKNDRII